MKGELTNSGGSVSYLNNVPNAPAAAAFFSQLVWAGDTAYLAGQIGMSPVTQKIVEGGTAAEAEQIFDNIDAVLTGAGLSLSDAAKVSVYLTTMADMPVMNEVYQRRMGEARPARETVAVTALALGAKIEITVTAFRK